MRKSVNHSQVEELELLLSVMCKEIVYNVIKFRSGGNVKCHPAV